MSLESLRNPPPGQPLQWSKRDRVHWSEGASRYVSAGRAPGNIFSRVMDWLRRSGDTVEANKITANKFIEQLDDRYGETISQWATERLSGQLTKGRPLSWRRVGIILTKAEATATQARGYNTQVLNRLSGEMINEAIRDLFDLPDDFTVHRNDRDKMQWLEGEVDGAVQSEPSFGKFPLDDPDFRDAYTRTVNEAVDAFYDNTFQEELAPLENLAGLVPAGRFPRLQPLIEMSSAHDGGPLAVQEDLMALVAMGRQTKSLLDPISSGEGVQSRDDTVALTAFLARLGMMRKTIAEAEPGNPNEADLRKAIGKDAEALDDTITEMLGIGGLGEERRSEVVDAFREVQDLQEKVENPQAFLVELATESARMNMKERLQAAEDAFRSAKSDVDEAGGQTLDALVGFAGEVATTLRDDLEPLAADLRALADAHQLNERLHAKHAERPDEDEVEATMRNLHRISRSNRGVQEDREPGAKVWVRGEAASLRATLAHASGLQLESEEARSPFPRAAGVAEQVGGDGH